MLRKIYHKLRRIPVLGALLGRSVAVGYLILHAPAILKQYDQFRTASMPGGSARNKLAAPSGMEAGSLTDIGYNAQRLELAMKYIDLINTLQTEQMSKLTRTRQSGTEVPQN